MTITVKDYERAPPLWEMAGHGEAHKKGRGPI